MASPGHEQLLVTKQFILHRQLTGADMKYGVSAVNVYQGKHPPPIDWSRHE
ncbi:10050_t:CDS:2 [Dentiscutata erythropus]|uniref:10050_t:CDS:1 n=1 Tax=Dentiscutata erythropus TaxID=1348616 RepID=A0A9N9FPX9_9GLOM|nr:10050_t:CDS:2 [Dentiscutata erythropus]